MNSISSSNSNPSIGPIRADILSKPGKAEGKITGKVSFGHIYIQDTWKSFNYITLNSLNKFPRFKQKVNSLLTRQFTPINIQTSTGEIKTVLVKTSSIAKFLGANKKEIKELQKSNPQEITNRVSQKQQDISNRTKQKGVHLASEERILKTKRNALLQNPHLGRLNKEGILVPKDAAAEKTITEELEVTRKQYREFPPEKFLADLDHFNKQVSPHLESWKEEAANSSLDSTIKSFEYRSKEGKTTNVEVLITPGGRVIAQIPNSEFARGQYKKVSLGVDLHTGNLLAYQNLSMRQYEDMLEEDKNPIKNEQMVMSRVENASGIAVVIATAHTQSSDEINYRVVQNLYTSGSLLDQTPITPPEVLNDPKLKSEHMKNQEAKAIPIMLKAAKALFNFHNQTGCMHGDLKLDNFLVNDQQVFITDYDKMKDWNDQSDVRAFLRGGTEDYSPPSVPNMKEIREELQQSTSATEQYGQATDVYSLGIMMLMITLGKDQDNHEHEIVSYKSAQPVHEKSSEIDIAKRKADLEEIYSTSIPADTPYQKLAKRALHPDPTQRPTMKEVIQELAKLDAELHLSEINDQQKRSSFFSRMSLRG